MRISVIIATYNQHEWLRKVLWGYQHQTYQNFEIIIADDGSDEKTKKVIEEFKSNSTISLTHLWHEDKGYRRQTILNRAISEANTNYILFTDGDCIPRSDFIETHIRHIEKGHYLSGSYCKLPIGLSQLISEEDVISGNAFNLSWLQPRGLKGFSQRRKLWAKGKWADFLDRITTAKPTFNNCNVSAWKEDLLKVNGYNEDMKYGGADREIGERLNNLGITGKQIRHRAICIHLDHPRGYKTKEDMQKNMAIRENVRKNKVVKTMNGIKKDLS